MEVVISPSSVSGNINAPASKSVMQRAVACALLAEGRSEIINPSLCDDSLASLSMAECLGAGISRLSDRVLIDGGFHPVCNSINCGESGLGARVFSVLAALGSEWMEVKGRGSLLKRPLKMLAETLTQMGVEVSTTDGSLPLRIKGPMRGGLAFVDGSVSSQFLTGLLIAMPVLDADSRIIVKRLKSKPYIDLTINVLNHFGIELVNEDYEMFSIPGRQKYKPVSYTVEGDWSGTALLLVLAAIAGEIKVSGISYLSAQPDSLIIEILRKAGAHVEMGANDILVRKSELSAFETDISDCPDLAPPLAVLASRCRGKSVIHGTERLKVKESNRGEALATELSKMGVKISNHDNRIEVEGSTVIRGGRHGSYGDHRIAMALTVLSALADSEVVISGTESVNKSYPSFFDDLNKIGMKFKITR
ncbi:MAG: 3-phosphoshikimate 1-carboxyvinyltransferase [Bacteroidales bacterium]|nr:3-phosphoshikimate 1-carboxyvinyltransferase [Bacteroidales bacterium]